MLMPDKIITGNLQRVERLRQSARHLLLSGVLVHKSENIYYFTSFLPREPSFLTVCPEHGAELVASEKDYREAVEKSCVPVVSGGSDTVSTTWERMLDRKILKPPPKTIFVEFMRKIAESPLGMEADYLSVDLFKKFKIRNHTDITPSVADFRSKKDRREIDFIEQACRAADSALAETMKSAGPGVSERLLAGVYCSLAMKKGADEAVFRFASTKNSALEPLSRMEGIIERGPLIIDYGARVNGYWGCMTRTFHVGEPDTEFLNVYEAVMRARSEALESVRPGKRLQDPENVARAVLRRHGFEKNNVLPIGHGIGLEIREAPTLHSQDQDQGLNEPGDLARTGFGKKPFMTTSVSGSPGAEGGFPSMSGASGLVQQVPDNDEDLIERTNVFTFGPGIYAEQASVRVRDTVLVEGKPEQLSSFTTEISEIVTKC